MTYERFDVVIVPFPFTDKAQAKRRPALILSSRTAFGRKAGHGIMAMITSASNPPWPLDVLVSDKDSAGLPAPSIVRMKLFTLDHRFVIAKRGTLSDIDQRAVSEALKAALGF